MTIEELKQKTADLYPFFNPVQKMLHLAPTGSLLRFKRKRDGCCFYGIKTFRILGTIEYQQVYPVPYTLEGRPYPRRTAELLVGYDYYDYQTYDVHYEDFIISRVA